MMSVAAFLEIIENEDGDIVLRRTDSSPGNPDPLVAIRFSEEVRDLLGDDLPVVAQAMIGAGVQAATQLRSAQMLSSDDEPRLLH